jgi:apolipoprotein D and lipocalin family protein
MYRKAWRAGSKESRGSWKFASFVWGDYWVIDLDPGYQWAVVGEPRRKYLWILSRTPDMEREVFERIKRRAAEMGYEPDALIISAPLR